MWRPNRENIAMRAKQLITITAAVMLLIGGTAAVGAASPVNQINDSPADANEDDVTDDEDARNALNESGDRAGNADGVGSDGLSDLVPDHVSQIHETIESFLNSSTENLGESLNELLSDGEQRDTASE